MRLKRVNVTGDVKRNNFVALEDIPNAWFASSPNLLCVITGEKRAKGNIYNILYAPIVEDTLDDEKYLALIPVIEERKGTLEEVKKEMIDLMYGEVFNILKLPTKDIVGIDKPKELYEELQ